MPIDVSDSVLVARELLSVEDAESVLDWLIQHPHGQIDLADCNHVHAANFQVLMAARPKIAAWPQRETLADWLRAALIQEDTIHVQDDSGS
ncbi:hypothetical protein [Allochromatium palmeri]|uniref:Uncharacterized protein n=1 Tax=Allochromatium palmeri TaxID=231048 RepID=A0A6N8EAX3_9GAMM|nr:hypothetical protein [Allochromatium palmeri]MTW21422.1 hypothetical protein [Allochromatium palmeri]